MHLKGKGGPPKDLYKASQLYYKAYQRGHVNVLEKLTSICKEERMVVQSLSHLNLFENPANR